jgi:hypothetical protein
MNTIYLVVMTFVRIVLPFAVLCVLGALAAYLVGKSK